MAESPRPALSSDALTEWCLRWLGAAPAVELLDAGFLSVVKGLRLTDGREIIVKVRPGIPRLAGCAAVHRSLWVAGFPCAEPLVDLQPLFGGAANAVASAESLMPSKDEPPSEDLASHSAAALASDLNDFFEPQWLTRVAAAIRGRLRNQPSQPESVEKTMCGALLDTPLFRHAF